MTIAEKIQLSADSKTVTLFKEGLFYRCFNEDAMVFVKRIKDYKVSAKFVKSVAAEVYSIGFPISGVEKGTLSVAFISEKISAKNFEEKGACLVFWLNNEDLKNGYHDWINSIFIGKKDRLEEPSNANELKMNYQSIISEIKNYDLANSTPMQSLGFIQHLKEKVQHIEHNYGNL